MYLNTLKYDIYSLPQVQYSPENDIFIQLQSLLTSTTQWNYLDLTKLHSLMLLFG